MYSSIFLIGIFMFIVDVLLVFSRITFHTLYLNQYWVSTITMLVQKHFIRHFHSLCHVSILCHWVCSNLQVWFWRKSAGLLCSRKHDEEAILHFKQSFQVFKIAVGGRWEKLMDNHFHFFCVFKTWVRVYFLETFLRTRFFWNLLSLGNTTQDITILGYAVIATILQLFSISFTWIERGLKVLQGLIVSDLYHCSLFIFNDSHLTCFVNS